MELGEKPKGLFSEYLNRVSAWNVAGYRFFYSQAAVAIGHMGFGFLAPFQVYLESNKGVSPEQSSRAQYEIINPSLPQKRKHQSLKENSVGYRGLHRYVKTLSRLNEDFIMRPVANIFALAGGLIGLTVGLPLSLFGFNPPKQDEVTEKNNFFSRINLSRETRNFFGVVIWGAIAGYVFGSFYTAPITILGNTFQGASAFGQLFSAAATFIYELPTLLKNTWEFVKELPGKVKQAMAWIGEKLKTIGEFVANKLGWVLDKGLQFLNWSGQKIKAGFTKCYQFVSQALTWVKDQFSFVLNKIGKVLTVIKENGIRGFMAWIKDKTIGASIRYFESLSAVRTVTNEVKGLVYHLLDNELKRDALLKTLNNKIDWLTLDLPKMPKLDQVKLIMSHINTIANAHRTNYQHGNVQVQLDYLEALKLNLMALKSANFDDSDELSSDLVTLLDSKYLSWQSAEKEADKEPEPVDFLGTPSKTHLPQHKAGLSQAQQQGASNDGASIDDELKSKKGSWFSCSRK